MPSVNGTTQMKMYEVFVTGKQGLHRTSDNTVVDNTTGLREVRLHGNPIVVWRPSTGALVLSSCGWATQTTMRKLNCICENLWLDGILPMKIWWHVVKGETAVECGYALTTDIIVVKNVKSLDRPNPDAYVIEVIERKMAEAAARQHAPLQFDNMLEAL